MVSIYKLKPKFQNLLRPLTRWLAKCGVTANQVTITAMVLSIITGALIYIYFSSPIIFFIVPLVLFLRMALNAIDGMLAREHDMQTPLGNVLNELGDVISDTALYLPFVLLDGVNGTLIVVIVLLAVISELAGVLGVVIGASRRYDGPIGKSDRAFFFGAVSLLFACGIEAGGWLQILLWLMVIGLVINIVNRIRKALKEVT